MPSPALYLCIMYNISPKHGSAREEPDISVNGKAHLHLLYTRACYACNVSPKFGESCYVQTCSWEKNYGFTSNSDFNPLFTRFISAYKHAFKKYASTSREKRTSKYCIKIVLKLVSNEYQKRDVFLAVVQLGGNRLTFQSSAPSV